MELLQRLYEQPGSSPGSVVDMLTTLFVDPEANQTSIHPCIHPTSFDARDAPSSRDKVGLRAWSRSRGDWGLFPHLHFDTASEGRRVLQGAGEEGRTTWTLKV